MLCEYSNAYSARAHPPLGRADNNVINLIPAYRQLLKRIKPSKVRVRQLTQDAIMQLHGYLACTEWDVFAPDSVNLNEYASTIMDYITFCIDSTIPTKTVTVYPFAKPWIMSHIKNKHLRNKQRATSKNLTGKTKVS